MTGSIQDAREAYAKNAGHLLRADGQFFTDCASRYEALRNKSSHPSDFRRLRNDVHKWTVQHTSKQGWNAALDQPVYDGASAFLDLIDCEIELRVVSDQAFGTQAAGNSKWRNAKTGEAVQIYAPEERLSGERSGGGDIGVGELLEGMFFGATRPEIKAALESGTNTAGGYTVTTQIARQFIDKLRAQSVFIQAGAQTMMLQDQRTRIVRLEGDPTATWRAENASIGDSDIVLGAVEMTARSLSTLVKVPYELLADAVNVGDILSRALLSALTVELDRACLFGTGSGNQPLGLFSTPNINSVSMGTDGATPTSYDDLLDVLYELELDNAAAPTAAIWHPRTARTYRKLKDLQNNPLHIPAPLDTLPKLSTTAVPITQVQGSSGSVCSTVLVGDFSEAILGMREELHILQLDQTFAANGQIAFWARLRADVGFAHGQSFCKLIGVKQ